MQNAHNRGLTVFHISWAYKVLTSKTADNRGLTVIVANMYTGNILLK